MTIKRIHLNISKRININRNFTLILLFFWRFTLNLSACDICGCSISSGFSGILPQYQKHFIGVRTTYSRFEAYHPENTGIINYQNSASTELLGRYYPHRRVQFIASLPYNVKVQKEENSVVRSSALGDLAVNMNYTLLDRSRDSFKWKHLLLMGGGMKLPTGKNNVSDDKGELIPAMQPGSGSIDYLLNLTYIIRYKKYGLANDLQYRMNNANSKQYAMGNKLTVAPRLFYWINAGRFCKIIPGAGALIEKMDKDLQKGYAQDMTGGSLYSASASCEVYYRDCLLSCQYVKPFRQHLGDGYLKSLARVQVSAYLMF